jgi:tripartite-type tricarboxylate transporter receptor subunit TctC
LFVTNSARSPQAPEVPTATEAGYPGLTFEGVSGVFGWRGMPAEIRTRVVTDVAAIVADPAFQARAVSVGTAARPGTPDEFAAALEQQRATIAAIHEAAGVKPAQ